jgi:hypothetical protein
LAASQERLSSVSKSVSNLAEYHMLNYESR